jgi:hypothetical protein
MNREQLKELVKAHFNLVDNTTIVTEEKFGEIYDENKAFKIVFPGEELKVKDKVKVVTAEGQEMDAPDGYHKLENGLVIKTEGSVVTEIEKAENSVEIEVEEEFVSEVEGTTPQNTVTETNVTPEDALEQIFKKIMMEFEPTGSIGDILQKKIEDAVKAVTEPMVTEMAKMKVKMEEIASLPASEKTMINSEMKSEKFSTATNDLMLKALREKLNNKK